MLMKVPATTVAPMCEGADSLEMAAAQQAAAMPTFCPVAAMLDLLHERWTLHIVHALLLGKKRFNEIGHALGGVNPRTLRERLRGLEEQGIVERRVVRTIPPWVEYELTEKGRALERVMDAMSDWARAWLTASPRNAPRNEQTGCVPD
jgi:DNA-binding HxlR family transcriptional regulator